MDAAILCDNLAQCYLKLEPPNLEMMNPLFNTIGKDLIAGFQAFVWFSELEALYAVQEPDHYLREFPPFRNHIISHASEAWICHSLTHEEWSTTRMKMLASFHRIALTVH